jgi:hypothetical protein
VLFFDLLGEDRVIGAAARRQDKFFMTGEFGGAGSFNLAGLDIILNGVRGLMNLLGMLPADELAPVRPEVRRLEALGMHYLFASRSGIFEPCFSLGDDVRYEQIAARIYQPEAPWQAPVEPRWRSAGTVLCRPTLSPCEVGHCLGHF